MTEEDLHKTFSEAGTVTEAIIIKDKESGRPKGFGFVTMSSDEEAEAAIAKFNGKELFGRALKVNKARPLEERKSGQRGGGRGGNRGGGRPGGNRGGGRPGGNRGGNQQKRGGGNRSGGQRPSRNTDRE